MWNLDVSQAGSPELMLSKEVWGRVFLSIMVHGK